VQSIWGEFETLNKENTGEKDSNEIVEARDNQQHCLPSDWIFGCLGDAMKKL